MFYTYLVFLWQLSVIHPFLHFPIYNSFPIGCHFIFSHVPFSVIHHSVSSSISCHHLLSVISYCLSFLIIYHPYRLYITQHCWSISTFCHSPMVYHPNFLPFPHCLLSILFCHSPIVCHYTLSTIGIVCLSLLSVIPIVISDCLSFTIVS